MKKDNAALIAQAVRFLFDRWGLIAASAATIIYLSGFVDKEKIPVIGDIKRLEVSIDRKFDAFGRRLSVIERDVEELKPPDAVAVYDKVRSLVRGPCVVGAFCEGRYRVRRTSWGERCDSPNAVAIVSNHDGIRRAVETSNYMPVRATREWSEILFSFRVPEAVQPGRAEFYFALEFVACSVPVRQPDGRTEFVKKTIKQRSLELVFDVVRDG